MKQIYKYIKLLTLTSKFGEQASALTGHHAGEGNTGDSLEGETMLVVSCHPQEEGLFGRDELRDVPQAVRLPLGVVAYRQGFDRLPRDRQEVQPVSSSRSGQPGGV